MGGGRCSPSPSSPLRLTVTFPAPAEIYLQHSLSSFFVLFFFLFHSLLLTSSLSGYPFFLLNLGPPFSVRNLESCNVGIVVRGDDRCR
jgi:hypothetical protein